MATLAQPPQGVSTGPDLDNRRIAAALIDLVVPAVIATIAFAAGLSLTPGVVLIAVGWTLYYFFALESGDGQTLGKRVMKLRVVSADGTPASMEQVAKRTLVRILDGHIVGLIVMLASGERRQRLGDLVAGTVVTDATPDVAPARATADGPAPLLAVPTEAGEESVPWHKRSLNMPAFPKPSRRKTSSPKGKRSFSLPSLPKRSPSSGAPALMAPAAMPVAAQPDPVAEVRPFAPFTEPGETIEREPAPAYSEDISGESDQDPVLDPREPDFSLQFEGETEAAWRPEPPAQHEESHPGDEDEQRPEESVQIKPLETVSAIDFVMQEAEDRDPRSH